MTDKKLTEPVDNPNRLTDKEIIKSLEECIELRFDDTEYATVKLDTLTNALDLITRQKAEIERLREETAELIDDRYATQLLCHLIKKEDDTRNVRLDAIKEFAERLKEKSYKTIRNYGLTKDVVEVCDIDNLVKEMVGDNNAERYER